MNRPFLNLFILFSADTARAQTPKPDSLNRLIRQVATDTGCINLINQKISVFGRLIWISAGNGPGVGESVQQRLLRSAREAERQRRRLPATDNGQLPTTGRVTIRIRDNGTGIPQAVLGRIYQPFFTAKPTGEGTGLGLSDTKSAY